MRLPKISHVVGEYVDLQTGQAHQAGLVVQLDSGGLTLVPSSKEQIQQILDSLVGRAQAPVDTQPGQDFTPANVTHHAPTITTSEYDDEFGIASA